MHTELALSKCVPCGRGCSSSSGGEAVAPGRRWNRAVDRDRCGHVVMTAAGDPAATTTQVHLSAARYQPASAPAQHIRTQLGSVLWLVI